MLSSTNFCSLTSPSYFPSLDSDTTSHGYEVPDPFIPHPSLPGSIVPSIDPYFCSCQSGSNPTIPINYASGQDTRMPVLLDTRKWSPSPGFTGPHVISDSESQFLSMDAGFATPHSHLDAIFPFNRAFGDDMQPMPQGILGTRLIPNLSSGFLGPMGNCDATFGTDLNHATLLASNSLAQLPASPSTEYATCSIGDERESPLAIYRSPDRKGLGRRPSQCARAVNIGGVRIDEDDLYSSAGKGCRIIVHECQWNKSSDACGMWIVGSRTRVGTHIRKWHNKSHADNTGRTFRCLWNGCTKAAMLKDSINRHIVTVHLGEGYHCLGCDQVFSRQDVYDEHVEDDEAACRDAGAVMVYGTDCRVIDTSQILSREFAVQAN